jgi:hypothetical protein
MTHTVDSLMALADRYRDLKVGEGTAHAREALRTALTEALGFRPDWADFENGRKCGKLEVAQPHNADPSCDTVELAEMILSDCGCSSNNTSLVSRVANRIDAYVQAKQQVQEVANDSTHNYTRI